MSKIPRMILGIFTLGLFCISQASPARGNQERKTTLLPAELARIKQQGCNRALRLSGTLIQPPLVETWNLEKWKAELQHMKDACITQVILQWTADSKS